MFKNKINKKESIAVQYNHTFNNELVYYKKALTLKLMGGAISCEDQIVEYSIKRRFYTKKPKV